MRARRKLVTLVCLGSSILLVSCSDPAPAEADRIVEEFVHENNIVGLQAAIGLNGRLAWSKGVGYADLEQLVAVDPSVSLMRIGSVAKSITAVAAGRMIESDLIDLDAPLQTYLPDYPPRRWPITLRQIGGHQAGIRHYRDAEFLSNRPYATVRDGLAIFRDDTLLFEPGSRYSYSTYGFNLISAVLEAAAEQEFLSLMRGLVLDPLEMSHTFADRPGRILPGRGRYYQADSAGVISNAPYVDNSYKWAGGGYLSTAEDLVRFGNGLLEGELLQAATWQLLTTPQLTTAGDSTSYGIGWRSRADDDGTQWLGHSGGSVGGVTQFRIYPEQGVVVAIIVNMSRTPYGDLAERLARAFF